MVRYQSNQSIEKQIEQRQLLSTKNPSLRTNAVLRTKNQTILKTNMSYTNANTKTKLRQKRRLLVYNRSIIFKLLV